MNLDLVIEILNYLPLKDKVNSALICKDWYSINKYIYRNQLVKVNYNTLNTSFYDWFLIRKPDLEVHINTEICIFKEEYKDHIKKLKCKWALMYKIPNSILELTELEHLDASCNKIKDISDIHNTKLKVLLLARNFITHIPETILNLSELQVLKLNHNRLFDIPININKLEFLTELHLEKNRIQIIPDSICQLIIALDYLLSPEQLKQKPTWEEARFFMKKIDSVHKVINLLKNFNAQQINPDNLAAAKKIFVNGGDNLSQQKLALYSTVFADLGSSLRACLQV